MIVLEDNESLEIVDLKHNKREILLQLDLRRFILKKNTYNKL